MPLKVGCGWSSGGFEFAITAVAVHVQVSVAGSAGHLLVPTGAHQDTHTHASGWFLTYRWQLDSRAMPMLCLGRWHAFWFGWCPGKKWHFRPMRTTKELPY